MTFDLKQFLAQRAGLDWDELSTSLDPTHTGNPDWVTFLDDCKVDGGLLLHDHLTEQEFNLMMSVSESLAIAIAASNAARSGGVEEAVLIAYLTHFVKKNKGEIDALITIIVGIMLGVGLKEGWLEKPNTPNLDIHVPDL